MGKEVRMPGVKPIPHTSNPPGCRTQQPNLQGINVKSLQVSPAKMRKKKMALPRRILRILESSKRVHFQNVSLSKKRHMCINQYLPPSAALEKNAEVSQYEAASTSSNFVEQFTKNTKGVVDIHVVTSIHSRLEMPSLCNVNCSSNDESKSHAHQNVNDTHKPQDKKVPKEVVAVDCEMVGVGQNGRSSALARCSIVDYSGRTIFDEYVKPNRPITDYRTRWSGICPCHMVDAMPFDEARHRVKNILKEKTVVGHAIINDFQALDLSHPAAAVRDTSRCRALMDLLGKSGRAGQPVSLKALSKQLLGTNIQTGEHCSVEDAMATMKLYKLVEKCWEEELVSTFPDQDFRTSFLDDHFWPDDLF